MKSISCVFIAACLLLSTPSLFAQASESAIEKQMGKLRSMSTTDRPVATIKLAHDIASLPASQSKVRLAYGLAGLVTEGDQGQDALQAVGDALTKSLAESPVPAKGDQVPPPYMELASIVRYKNVTTTLNDPLLAKATQTLIDNDADVAKADFTLKDLKGKKYTLSELKGKVVMVNFWATWCPPCRKEMPDLDVLSTYFQSQGLVILSISDENPFKVNSFIAPTNYHPVVLIDSDGKVHKQFHIEGIPKTFLFGRDGKLLGETIDECTRKQFLELLSKTDLHPN